MIHDKKRGKFTAAKLPCFWQICKENRDKKRRVNSGHWSVRYYRVFTLHFSLFTLLHILLLQTGEALGGSVEGSLGCQFLSYIRVLKYKSKVLKR